MYSDKRAYINKDSAYLYELDASSSKSDDPQTLTEVTLAEQSLHQGLVGSPAFLAAHDSGAETSVTKRGYALAKVGFCDTIPPAPADVDNVLPPRKEEQGKIQTAREQVEFLRTDPDCWICHGKMDPYGLGLEAFDILGIPRGAEELARIDTSGEVGNFSFANTQDLLANLAKSPEVEACFVRHVYRFITGHEDTIAQQDGLRRLTDRFREQGHSLKSLIVDIVLSPFFRSYSTKDTQ